jgi:SAM-dependent methyltransferase
MNSFHPLRILYINVIENNAGWGAEWFINRGLQALGHQTHCIDFRKHRHELPELLQKVPAYDIFFLQRGDYFPLELIRSSHGPRLFWASELVERCRDQDPLLQSNLFDHVFFHSERCIDQVVSRGWLDRSCCSVLLNGFDETVHRPLPDCQKTIDLLFVGTLTERRQTLLNRLQSSFSVTIASAFGAELVRLFNQARIVLNLHAEDSADVETRVFEALGCGAFLLSEKLSEENPFDGRHLVEFDSFNDLCQKIHYYLSHANERDQIAAQGHAEALVLHTYTRRADEIAAVMSRCLKHFSSGLNLSRAPEPATSPSSIPTNAVPLGASVRHPAGLPDKGTLPPHPSTDPVLQRPLRIFAAFSQTNWEDFNLQPGLMHFGEVVRFDWKEDYDQYDPQWHWSLKQKMNLELLNRFYQAHLQKPFDLFFGYLSGRLIFPGFIRTISRLGIPSLNICLDDRAKFFGELEPTGYSGMVDIAAAFSLCWTTDKSALEHYAAVNANVVYLPPAANPDIFRPLDLPKTMDVVFVGQNYGQRARIIAQLQKQGIAVQTFGSGWQKGAVPMSEMIRLFSQSRIVLGINLVADSADLISLKGRDFEVPMCGALYLTQANPDLADFFEIGKEIVCYDSLPDLVDKIRYYLSRPQAAEEIRQSALIRSRKEHTWAHRFQTAFAKLGLWPFPGNDLHQPEIKTSDDWTYYHRENQKEAGSKKQAIQSFVLDHPDIKSVLDVGCNTGEMSAPFLEHGLEVLGLDSSDNLHFKQGYRFIQCDVASSNAVFTSDCILFCSLYHHLFRSLGCESADELFLKFLLRSKYLIFDCGNVQEQGVDRQAWVQALSRSFASEKDLLDHFNLPYQTIGGWSTGGASRSIVVFQNRDFDRQVEVIDEFRRPIGSPHQHRGLTAVKEIKVEQAYFQQTQFFKLRLDRRLFFGKKHLVPAWETVELEKIKQVYRYFPKEELLTFYGCSKRFGLIYEWLDDLKYLDKVRDQEVHGVWLHDADRIEVDGRLKYIDFWSDPAKSENTSSPLFNQIQQLLQQGENHYQAHDFEKARQCFQEILALYPNHLEALNNLGVVAFQEGQVNAAIAYFKKIIDLDPDYAEARENLSKCLELGNFS